MPTRTRRRRATTAVLRGRQRAQWLAHRLGIGIREARLRAGWTQSQLAATSGLSQTWISAMERGSALSASLESWAAVGAALGLQLAAFLEQSAGADQPRDIQHLRRQDLIIRTAAPGGWEGRPEVSVRLPNEPLRSVDVLLVRPSSREAAMVEVWDLLSDVGQGWRSSDAKVDAIRRRLGEEWRVEALWVVRATRRNRELIREMSAVFSSRFPAAPSAWVHALNDPDSPMPPAAGLIWTDVQGDRLFRAASHQTRINTTASTATARKRSVR